VLSGFVKVPGTRLSILTEKVMGSPEPMFWAFVGDLNMADVI